LRNSLESNLWERTAGLIDQFAEAFLDISFVAPTHEVIEWDANGSGL
jgi:hypothetical protein